MSTASATEQVSGVDYDALRARLALEKGSTYWRSLEELATLDEFDELVHREFPNGVSDVPDPVSRRNFFKVMGASIMLAGLANCSRQPEEKIVPYVKQPEELVPGKAEHFATAMSLSGYGLGLVATSHTNRPTKLEGLAEHPSSRGRTDAFAQAVLLDMYDPDRLDTVLNAGNISTYDSFAAALLTQMRPVEASKGAGLRILTETVTSPTLARLLNELLGRLPEAKWHQYEPVGRDNVRQGALDAFGEYVETIYDFSKAKIVVSLDADFFSTGPGRVRYTADFADRRDADTGGMNRLYVAEASPTLTGANADHKVNLRYPQVETLARVLAQRLGVPGVLADEAAAAELPKAWVDALVNDLEHEGKSASIIIAGDTQPSIVHVLAHAINAALGNTGQTVLYTEAVEARPANQIAELRQLAGDIKSGKVDILVILGGNPAYTAPADIDLHGAIAGMANKNCVYLTSHLNETSEHCHWCLPEAHFLEAWSDVRGHDGTVSIVQPLIAPLYPDAKSANEVVALLQGQDKAQGYDLVRQTWQAQHGGPDFERNWKFSLSLGVVDGTAAKPKTLALKNAIPAHRPVMRTGVDVVFHTDPAVYDGRFANNGWLQELPRPLTKLTWDNAVLMSRSTAEKQGVKDGDLVEVKLAGRTVCGPVLVQLGHPEESITLHLGYGRARCGKVGSGVGFNAYTLRTAASLWYGAGASITKTGETYPLSRTEDHHLIEQNEAAGRRHLVREAPLDHFREHPDFAQHMGAHTPAHDFTMYNPDEKKWDGYAWGMTIDLNRCTGCNACIVACQSENNIAIVGKDQISRGREMQWIRVDRYYKAVNAAGFDDPEVVFQPIPCMQCENAPCEPVCPVGATMHSKEGLNDMVYNRCVGTRYCANNCPYKVRRFNFYKFADHETPQLKLMRNPNVSVRGRGVMEKCTYCVQRINAARIEAKREGRSIRDGEVVTACQSACPAGAIVFGNLNDPESRVVKMKANPRNYGLLADVGTRPRTTYLAKLRNPAPALAHELDHQPTEHA